MPAKRKPNKTQDNEKRVSETETENYDSQDEYITDHGDEPQIRSQRRDINEDGNLATDCCENRQTERRGNVRIYGEENETDQTSRISLPRELPNENYIEGLQPRNDMHNLPDRPMLSLRAEGRDRPFDQVDRCHRSENDSCTSQHKNGHDIERHRNMNNLDRPEWREPRPYFRPLREDDHLAPHHELYATEDIRRDRNVNIPPRPYASGSRNAFERNQNELDYNTNRINSAHERYVRDTERQNELYRPNRIGFEQHIARERTTSSGNIKLPAFTGDDDWRVWISRFEAIAHRRRWTDEEKLDELLPRLQGGAGEFVFTQLPKLALSNYRELIRELSYRYRIIENTKSYVAQFANRNQKSGEMVEQYAAELKRLHHKAYPHKDRIQRKDDLLERFMRGLIDEEVRFFVNYMKRPEDIDEAVYAVVECISERQFTNYRDPYNDRRMKRQIRRTNSHLDEEYEGDTEDEGSTNQFKTEKTYRVNTLGAQKTSKIPNSQKENTSKNQRPDCETNNSKTEYETKALIEQLQNRIATLEKQVEVKEREDEKKKTQVCYNCNKPGHYSKNCRAPRSQFRSQNFNYNNMNNQGNRRPMNTQHSSSSLNSMGRP